jgi:hypothetical protein
MIRRLATLTIPSFWACLALMHAPALVSATRSVLHQPSAETVVMWAALLATLSLFVLKSFDVRWLRLGSRRRTALTFVIASAFVHHEAIIATTDEAAPVAVVTTVVAVAGVPLIRQLIGRVSSSTPRLLALALVDIETTSHLPSWPASLLAIRGPRPPPCLA